LAEFLFDILLGFWFAQWSCSRKAKPSVTRSLGGLVRGGRGMVGRDPGQKYGIPAEHKNKLISDEELLLKLGSSARAVTH
jgi:hypothetical protein